MLLFEPIKIKNTILKNRIVFPPTYTGMGVNTKEALEYYRERAAGGAGLVIVEGTKTDAFADKGFLADMKRLSGTIKDNGAAAVIQLVAASAINGEETWVSPRPGKRGITGEEIKGLIRGFAMAAREAENAGFDGIDIHGAHGYFWNMIFSPLHNRRDDEYGGSPENRMRAGIEAVMAIRGAVPAGFLIFYRHTPSEEAGGGYVLDDSIAFAKKLEEAGMDVLDVSPGKMPDGTIAGYAVQFKKYVRVPVMTVNGFDDPDAAEQALHERRCDLAGIGRGLIADPQWPEKVREGRLGEIVHCTRCDTGCYGNIRRGRPVKCVRSC
jgi:2,4-dienoyl-CoA reductase-like NADH-dependent reductase (Old Yellow Enzyme family)